MGIQFKKSEGQHMLINTTSIDKIIERAKIKHTDTILEIGSGTGNITMKLLEKAKKVIAFEPDRKLTKELKNKLYGNKVMMNKLKIIEDDALETEWPYFDKMISNIPFNISLPIILKLIQNNFHSAYILVQKEFADRLFAGPGDKNYSRLSVSFQAKFKAEHIMKVKKSSFIPQPKVDTCWIRIGRRQDVREIDIKQFDVLMKILFGRKNKTLLGNLNTPQFYKFLKETEHEKTPKKFIDDVLDDLNMKSTKVSKMSLKHFYKLFDHLKEKGINFE